MNNKMVSAMEKQRKALERTAVPQPTQNPAVPTPSMAGVDDARLTVRQKNAKSYGLGRTIVGGAYNRAA
jgi:hypothetical protein